MLPTLTPQDIKNMHDNMFGPNKESSLFNWAKTMPLDSQQQPGLAKPLPMQMPIDNKPKIILPKPTMQTQLISEQIEYLVGRTNKIFARHGSKNYVTTSAEVVDLSQDNVIQITLKYILIRPGQIVEDIFSTSVKIAKSFFINNQSMILNDLNETLFIEMLLHTDFDSKPAKPAQLLAKENPIILSEMTDRIIHELLEDYFYHGR